MKCQTLIKTFVQKKMKSLELVSSFCCLGSSKFTIQSELIFINNYVISIDRESRFLTQNIKLKQISNRNTKIDVL